MSTPPRRRRSPDTSGSGAGGGGWLPTIAIGLGVVIAGLGIGALVAVLMQRDTTKVQPVALVTSTPGRPIPPTRIPAPVTVATLEPPHTPQPSPSPTGFESAEPSPRPTLTAAPKPSRAPVPKPSLEPTEKPSLNARAPANAAVVAAATEVPKTAHAAAAATLPAESETPVPEALAVTPAPLPSRSPAPTGVAGAPSVETQSGYDERASAVVRRYIGALIRGDKKTAYAALGNEGRLSEQAFLDPGAQIVSLKVTRLDASNASVGCEIASAKGHYYGTYHVKAAAGGAYIAEHDYIKV